MYFRATSGHSWLLLGDTTCAYSPGVRRTARTRGLGTRSAGSAPRRRNLRGTGSRGWPPGVPRETPRGGWRETHRSSPCPRARAASGRERATRCSCGRCVKRATRRTCRRRVRRRGGGHPDGAHKVNAGSATADLRDQIDRQTPGRAGAQARSASAPNANEGTKRPVQRGPTGADHLPTIPGSSGGHSRRVVPLPPRGRRQS